MVYSLKAYAKVNIGLKITGRRDDGYHLISSYFLRVPFYDEISLEIKDGSSINIKGNEGYLDKGEDLMAKAARLYGEKTGLSYALDITIKKNIPSRAGLGGGSSDAASLLRALNNHFKAMSGDELFSFSSSVGADVPFFVSGYNFASVEGIGERIEEREFPPGYRYITLFRAEKSGVSTKEAYERIDSLSLSGEKLPSPSFPFKREDFPNDFEKVEGNGIYLEYKDRIGKNDYLSLSGSGSVWFLLSENEWPQRGEDFVAASPIFID